MINTIALNPSNSLEATLIKNRYKKFKIGNFQKVIGHDGWCLPNPTFIAKLFISAALFYGVELKQLPDDRIQLRNTTGILDDIGEEIIRASIETLPNRDVFNLPLFRENVSENEVVVNKPPT